MHLEQALQSCGPNDEKPPALLATGQASTHNEQWSQGNAREVAWRAGRWASVSTPPSQILDPAPGTMS